MALQSRVRVEQAKGIVAEQASVDPDQAFGLLRRYARDNNRRLGDVCTAIINGGLSATDFGGASARPTES